MRPGCTCLPYIKVFNPETFFIPFAVVHTAASSICKVDNRDKINSIVKMIEYMASTYIQDPAMQKMKVLAQLYDPLLLSAPSLRSLSILRPPWRFSQRLEMV